MLSSYFAIADVFMYDGRMKVIFIKDVGGVGRRDDVKEISSGYALNYLIPRGLAIQATPDKVSALEKRTKENVQSSAEHDAQLAAQIKSADGKKVVVKAKANEKGHLFKGIKKDDVASALAGAFGAFITPDNVAAFTDSIKETGEHVIHLVGAGAEATVNFVVEAAAS